MKRFLFSLAVFGTVAAAAQCPQITCPANINVGTDSNQCSAIVNYTINGGDTCGNGVDTFLYTGGQQFWVVPAGITSVNIQSWGAQGGTNTGGVLGGLGGSAIGTASVTGGDTLWVYVGGTSGYNGGGAFGAQTCAGARGGAGGGASDVRVGGAALTNRIIVAGGGGGAGGSRVQGCGRGSGGGGGGGYYGGGGGAGYVLNGTNAGGGTQTAGGTAGTTTYSGATNGTAGALGLGGNGGTEIGSAQSGSNTGLTGGTGGGLTGSAGQYAGNWTGGSGAGGSSYIAGLTTATTVAGVGTGDGMVVINYSSGPVTITQLAGIASGSAFPVGTTINTHMIQGQSGPNDTCSFTVTVADSGQATVLSALSQDTICTSSGTLTLPAGTPAGGTYTGTGVTGNSFDPAVAQQGTHWVYYTDTVGCQNSDSALVTVVWCTGIKAASLEGVVTIAPNPSHGIYNLSIPAGEHFAKVEVYDAVGRKVWVADKPANTRVIDIQDKPNGVYYIQLELNGVEETSRIIKH